MKKILTILILLFITLSFSSSADTYGTTITAIVPVLQPQIDLSVSNNSYIVEKEQKSDFSFYVNLTSVARCYGHCLISLTIYDNPKTEESPAFMVESVEIIRNDIAGTVENGNVSLTFTGTTVPAGSLAVYQIKKSDLSSLLRNSTSTKIIVELIYD